jgi:tetratricopeptide (TPR) repeat protein
VGGKRAGRRKQVYLYIAILISLNPLACALRLVDIKGDDAREHIEKGRELLAKGDYGGALTENEKAIFRAGDNLPADEALFNMGLIYAHPANTTKDADKAVLYFRKLISGYPKSPLVEQARIIIGLVQEREQIHRTIEMLNGKIEASRKLIQENDRLNRTIEQLNRIIEDTKKVDIGIDQKRKEKGK